MPSAAGSTVRSKVEEWILLDPIVVEIVCKVPPGLYGEKNKLRILTLRKVSQQAATEGVQRYATARLAGRTGSPKRSRRTDLRRGCRPDCPPRIRRLHHRGIGSARPL